MEKINLKNKLECSVSTDSIEKLEATIGKTIPIELKQFYNKYGCGLIIKRNNVSNYLLHPLEVIDFINHENDFEFIEDSDIYDDLISKQIPIIDIGDGTYLTIIISDKNNGAIMSYETIITKSFNEFINKVLKQPNFYSFIEWLISIPQSSFKI